MSRTASPRQLLIAVVVSLAVLLLPAPAGAAEVMPDVESAFVDAINASRALEGLASLTVNVQLTDIARAWSAQLDAEGRLRHNPDYSALYSGDWHRMGENVGYSNWPGADPMQIMSNLHQAFMGSPGHRGNILDGYNQVGVGVVLTGTTMWVTVDFMEGPLVEAALAAPAPVPRNHFIRR